MSTPEEVVSFSFEINVKEAYRDIRRIQTILYRTISILRRMGLPEDVEKAITLIQRLITLLNQLRLTMIALESATGPIGWGLALTSLASTAYASATVVDEVHSR